MTDLGEELGLAGEAWAVAGTSFRRQLSQSRGSPPRWLVATASSEVLMGALNTSAQLARKLKQTQVDRAAKLACIWVGRQDAARGAVRHSVLKGLRRQKPKVSLARVQILRTLPSNRK